MHGKTPQELHPVQGNRLFDGPVAVVFGNEGHPASGNIQDPLVGNSYPVGVLAQVFYDVINTCHCRLTMHHPTCTVCLLQLCVKKLQFSLFSQSPFKAVQEPYLKAHLVDHRIEVIP